MTKFLVSLPMMVVLAIYSFAATAFADDGFTVLYERAPWVVFHFSGKINGQQTSYCSAKAGTAKTFFEFSATKAGACIGGESDGWSFRNRRGNISLMVGNSGFKVDPGSYYNNVAQFCDKYERILSLFDLIKPGNTMDIYNYRDKKIGSFPVSGMTAARNQLVKCVNRL